MQENFYIFDDRNNIPMYIFNPEHDLCIANGDRNFVPPASALKFGKDCCDIMRLIFEGEAGGTGLHIADNDRRRVIAWGWNAALKHRLIMKGIPECGLPPDGMIRNIRELSHRRTALAARTFVRDLVSCKEYLVPDCSAEITDVRQIPAFLSRYGDAVLKAPWSGSGKGLRWVSSGQFMQNDAGWSSNVIMRQGSLIAERREDAVMDFAMLFHIDGRGVSSDGFSLFYNDNGAYRGNILASDGYILDTLSPFIPVRVIHEVRNAIEVFLGRNFAGRYKGPLGIDMFVCRNGNDYMLAPCVEINVRMTMGLLAGRYYRRIAAESGSVHDGENCLEVVSSSANGELKRRLATALHVLTPVTGDTSYAFAVFRR